MLVNFLILFFLLLIFYQIFLAYFNYIEGFDDYKEYDLNNPNNALILAQQNAGNISYLKERLDKLATIDKEVYDISLNMTQLNSQMTELVKQQANAATSLVGNTPPQISGTTESIVKI
jgi:hypothetical protein